MYNCTKLQFYVVIYCLRWRHVKQDDKFELNLSLGEENENWCGLLPACQSAHNAAVIMLVLICLNVMILPLASVLYTPYFYVLVTVCGIACVVHSTKCYNTRSLLLITEHFSHIPYIVFLYIEWERLGCFCTSRNLLIVAYCTLYSMTFSICHIFCCDGHVMDLRGGPNETADA